MRKVKFISEVVLNFRRFTFYFESTGNARVC